MLNKISPRDRLWMIGILIGIVYGSIARFIFGERAELVSITYLFIIPVILGIIPLFFASKEQVTSYMNIIFVPWLTVIAVFLVMYLTGMEEVICLLILTLPFFLLATLGAVIFRFYKIRQDKKKDNNTLKTIIVLLPFLVAPIEQAIQSPSEVYTVTSEVIINATPEQIWKNVIRVPKITEEEYTPGYFNYLGVPKPLEAKLTVEAPGALRIGHFEGGLTFIEHITEWQPYQKVSFDIKVDPKTIQKRVFDEHVLKGNYFHFVSASYILEPISATQVRLRLSSEYRLTSKVNFYNKFWGDLFLEDFQDRLLMVIQKRCNKK